MAAHSYITDPEFFTSYRATLQPIDPVKFRALLDLVTRAVYDDPTPFYQSLREGVIGQTTTPRNIGDVAANKEVLVEIDGPTRLPDNRLLDARLFTEHSLEHNLGILAFVGTDWKPTTPIAKLASSKALAEGLMSGGLHVIGDVGRIDTLWMLSAAGDHHWVTHYDEGRTITEFEYEQLTSDLSAA